MRKQMGKKAIKTALAASVAVSAVTVPASAFAAESTPKYDTLQQNLDKINSNLRAFERIQIGEKVTIIKNLTNTQWESIVLSKTTIDPSLRDEVKTITQEMIDLVLGEVAKAPGDVNVKNQWESFKTKNSATMGALLGSTWEDTLDLLFEFVTNYYNFNNTDAIVGKVISGNSKEQIARETLNDAKVQFDQTKLNTLQTELGKIGLNLDDLFTIYNSLIDEVDREGVVENALASSALRYKGFAIKSEQSTGTWAAVGNNTLTKGSKVKLSLNGPTLSDPIQNLVLNAVLGNPSLVKWYIDGVQVQADSNGFFTIPNNNSTTLTVKYVGTRTITLLQEQVTLSGATTSGGGPSGSPGTPSTNQPGPVQTEGPVVSAPVEKVQTPEGTKAVAKVDDNKITELITKGQITDKVAVTIEKAQGEIAEAVVSTKAIQALVNNNPNTVIQIATSDATYNLPANEINVQSLATALGVAVGDVEISIQVNTVAAPSSVASSNLVSPVLEFTIVARSGDKTVTIDKFTTYVERQVVASKDVNSKNVVAVRINADGSLSPVPTITEGNRITFKSNSNSKYTVVENNITFADIQNSWAKNDIETLANKLIIKGVDTNKFAPKAETTRAQVATLLTRSLGLQGQKATKVSFKDVKGNEWFAGDLAVAVNAGIVGGYEDGTFKPNQTITRQEAAAMIKRAMDFAKYDQAALQDDKKASSLYKDYSSVGNWAKNDIEVITQAGIMGGDEKGEFNPTDNTTREQLASILKRFMTFVKFTN